MLGDFYNNCEIYIKFTLYIFFINIRILYDNMGKIILNNAGLTN